MSKVHFEYFNKVGRAPCGVQSDKAQFTQNADEITCKNCLRSHNDQWTSSMNSIKYAVEDSNIPKDEMIRILRTAFRNPDAVKARYQTLKGLYTAVESAGFSVEELLALLQDTIADPEAVRQRYATIRWLHDSINKGIMHEQEAVDALEHQFVQQVMET
jgi:hypothetical protein